METLESEALRLSDSSEPPCRSDADDDDVSGAGAGAAAAAEEDEDAEPVDAETLLIIFLRPLNPPPPPPPLVDAGAAAADAASRPPAASVGAVGRPSASSKKPWNFCSSRRSLSNLNRQKQFFLNRNVQVPP